MRTMVFADLHLWNKKCVSKLLAITHRDSDGFEFCFRAACGLRTIAKLESSSPFPVRTLWWHKNLTFSSGFLSLAHKLHYFISIISFPFSNNFSTFTPSPHFIPNHAISLTNNMAFVLCSIFFIGTDCQGWKRNCFIFMFFSVSLRPSGELLFPVLSWCIRNNLACDLGSEALRKVQWYQLPSLTP